MSDPPQRGPSNQREPSRLPAGHPHEPELDLEDVLQRRVSVRGRVLQGLGLALMLTVVAALIARSLLGGTTYPRVVAPTPTAIALGPVLVLSNVSFGTLTLNGRPLPGPLPLAVTFRRGMNTFVLTAPPLLPLTCQVQWPAAQTQGQCDVLFGAGTYAGIGARPQPYVAAIDLWFSGQNLTADARTHTLDSITTTLRAIPLQMVVPAGEYIATGIDAHGGIISERLASGGHANLSASATTLDYTGDQFCASLACVPAPVSAHEWAVTTYVDIQWTYVPQTVSDPARSSPMFEAWSLRLVLAADAQAGWQIDQQQTEHLNGFDLTLALRNVVCRAAANYLDTVRPSNQLNGMVVADDGLAGCVLQFTTPAGVNAGTFLWRFGVLLAADRSAHALLPAIPIAPASAFNALGVPIPAGV